MQILKVELALLAHHRWTKKFCVVTNPYKCVYLVNLISWRSQNNMAVVRSVSWVLGLIARLIASEPLELGMWNILSCLRINVTTKSVWNIIC